MSMKIGLEISSLSFPLSGIQVYIKNFLMALLNVDKESDYFLTAKFMRHKKINEYHLESFWFKKYDIFHGFDGFIPRFIFAKLKSAVVHDVISLTGPSFVSESARKNFERKITKLVNRADILIAPSEYTKKALSSISPSSKIYVIYGACSEHFRELPEDAINKFKKEKGLNDYLLYVGVINARKNVDGLIKSFYLIKNKFKDLKLVIISSYTGYGSETVIKLINKNHDNSILFIENASEKDLIYFYNAATLFVFPSFAEGFGLPLLEAMACGSPVVTSNTTAMPEVGGDAVEYFNPHDIDNIAQKITEVLGDKRKREILSEKGLRRVEFFSWEKSARELLTVWKQCLNQ